MIEPQKLIDFINKDCKNLFLNNFILKPNSGHYNISRYRIEGTSNALNRFEIPFDSVKVLNWFDDFWLFLEVKFISLELIEGRKKSKQIHTYISLSIFQGKDSDDNKYQLFRAEWDDYNNVEEKHSQPHWHITSNQAIERTFEEYSNNFDNGDFISLLEEEKQKLFDVNKIHFAMNGNWQNGETHIHKINDEQQIVKWFQGILRHMRTELE
jgi:hypothetical protein